MQTGRTHGLLGRSLMALLIALVVGVWRGRAVALVLLLLLRLPVGVALRLALVVKIVRRHGEKCWRKRSTEENTQTQVRNRWAARVDLSWCCGCWKLRGLNGAGAGLTLIKKGPTNHHGTQPSPLVATNLSAPLRPPSASSPISDRPESPGQIGKRRGAREGKRRKRPIRRVAGLQPIRSP